jgi:hypothetical protein
MINSGFRTYDIESDDFPITVNASTDAEKLPDLAPVAFLFQDVNTGIVTRRKEIFKKSDEKAASLMIEKPDTTCNIVFAVQVRFPAANPTDKPLKVQFVSSDNQKAKDEIPPEDTPIVFANYVMHSR